tara:strand:- start:70 stop:321 length:252 start_codon:yes stop_codon:yes gene_type:complete
MKQLQKEFIGKGQVKGFKFTQIKQNENGYIYEVKANGLIHYEVFKHVENTRYECVSYPSNKAFGLWAKTYKQLDSAINHFNTL